MQFHIPSVVHAPVKVPLEPPGVDGDDTGAAEGAAGGAEEATGLGIAGTTLGWAGALGAVVTKTPPGIVPWAGGLATGEADATGEALDPDPDPAAGAAAPVPQASPTGGVDFPLPLVSTEEPGLGNLRNPMPSGTLQPGMMLAINISGRASYADVSRSINWVAF